MPSRLHTITTREADSTEQNPRLGQHDEHQNILDRWIPWSDWGEFSSHSSNDTSPQHNQPYHLELE